MNTFGRIYRLTTFGESHGIAIGGVIDGMPAGFKIDFSVIEREMNRRRPGTSSTVSQRKEEDKVQFLSGIDGSGVTLGTPIAFIIANTDANSADYGELEELYRPNHADFTYDAKYGLRAVAGGGRASARATASIVVGGSIARQALADIGVAIDSAVISVGGISGSKENLEAVISSARASGDSVGGIVQCTIKGVPTGLGEPLADKLHASLAHAMMSINAAKGFEYGDGFAAASLRGSESVDEFYMDDDGCVRTRTNHSGGIQGGISNGSDIVFKVAFKAVPSIPRSAKTIDKNGRETILVTRGRHDPCVVFRALPIVEAMAAMVIFDALLANRSSRWK